MTNWPQPFLDAGFTDAEIVEGVRWELEGTLAPHMVAYPKDSAGWQIRLEVFPGSSCLVLGQGTSGAYVSFHFHSLSLARQAAEDLVCRLHDVPTKAERELADLRRQLGRYETGQGKGRPLVEDHGDYIATVTTSATETAEGGRTEGRHYKWFKKEDHGEGEG